MQATTSRGIHRPIGWMPGASVALAVAVAALSVAACSNGSDAETITMDPESGVPEDVTYAPAPAPWATTGDGREEIVAACFGEGSWHVCRVAVDGSGTQSVVSAGAVPALASPDGSHLLLRTVDGPATLAASDGQVRTANLPGLAQWLDPDRLIAWVDGGYEVLDLDGTVTGTLAPFPVAEAGREPLWPVFPSPDGQAFVATTRTEAVTPDRLWLYRFDDDSWSAIDHGPGWIQIGAPTGWTADSRRILVTIQSEWGDELEGDEKLTSDLVEIDPRDGTRRTVASFDHRSYLSSVVCPDGRLAAVRSETATVFVEIATGAVSNRVVTGATSRFPSISWAPTCDRITLDIETKIAIVGVSPDLEASEPTIISATDYEDFIDPLWPG